MDLARVIGTVISTQKIKSLEGCHICILQPLNQHLESVGKSLVAIDHTCKAGRGEVVYYVGSGDAVLLEKGKPRPVDAAVVGILDWVDVKDNYIEEVPSLEEYRKD